MLVDDSYFRDFTNVKSLKLRDIHLQMLGYKYFVNPPAYLKVKWHEDKQYLEVWGAFVLHPPFEKPMNEPVEMRRLDSLKVYSVVNSYRWRGKDVTYYTLASNASDKALEMVEDGIRLYLEMGGYNDVYNKIYSNAVQQFNIRAIESLEVGGEIAVCINNNVHRVMILCNYEREAMERGYVNGE